MILLTSHTNPRARGILVQMCQWKVGNQCGTTYFIFIAPESIIPCKDYKIVLIHRQIVREEKTCKERRDCFKRGLLSSSCWNKINEEFFRLKQILEQFIAAKKLEPRHFWNKSLQTSKWCSNISKVISHMHCQDEIYTQILYHIVEAIWFSLLLSRRYYFMLHVVHMHMQCVKF